MSEAFIVRRGGAGFDFRVLGGTTEPSSPRANDIWVNTSETITGVIFSSTQPTGSAGLVWIQTGKSSPASFAADRGGTLYVYPDRCFQYVSNAWAAKTAKSYLNSAWVEWKNWLFREGEGPSASWKVTSYNSSTVVSGAVTDSKIQLVGTQNYNGERGLTSTSAVDLTDISKIYFELIANTNNVTAGVALSQIGYNTSFTRNSGAISTQTNVRKTVYVDVSNLTGNYYVGAKNGGDVTTNVTIFNIWGE